jgi:hypothetical protein
MLKTISKVAMDYTAFLSKTAGARKPSALRELCKFLNSFFFLYKNKQCAMYACEGF